ncbi:muscarinic acetylcholine receptor M5-like [Mya arenaria]|uniref:muscarinic acetylcholine receptor M5-like n=1 Tax=Mya arenaria TaxID=6604 RepID=UPI0022E327EC|nr:muscarinic acetylcholine receptor M5-like [Mya arenaria]
MNETLVNNTEIINNEGLHIPFINLVVGIILYIVVLITIFGNVLVLLAVRMQKNLRTTFNYYIVNLAITDLAVAVSAMSFKATQAFYGTYWPFGEFLCAVWIFFDYGMTFVSVFTLILISLDRFWSVTWSQHYRQHHSKRLCLFSIWFVWLFMLVLWVPAWLTDRLRHSKADQCYWNPALNFEFVFIVAIVGHHLPFVVMIFCFTRVYLFMKKRAMKIYSGLPAVVISTVQGQATGKDENKGTANIIEKSQQSDSPIQCQVVCKRRITAMNTVVKRKIVSGSFKFVQETVYKEEITPRGQYSPLSDALLYIEVF